MSTPTNDAVADNRRVPPVWALLFYAVLAGAAWGWLHLASPGRSAELWTHGVPEGLAAGIAAGTVLAALSWAALRGSRRARRLEAEFGELLGAQGRGEIVLLALLSGVAEEYFFRGALQERVGIWIAAGVFALLHWPLNRNLLPWPFLAGGVGVGLGYLCAWTGTLVAPAAAHALVNYVNLRRITARYGVWKEERVNAYIDRGRWT